MHLAFSLYFSCENSLWAAFRLNYSWMRFKTPKSPGPEIKISVQAVCMFNQHATLTWATTRPSEIRIPAPYFEEKNTMLQFSLLSVSIFTLFMILGRSSFRPAVCMCLLCGGFYLQKEMKGFRFAHRKRDTQHRYLRVRAFWVELWFYRAVCVMVRVR